MVVAIDFATKTLAAGFGYFRAAPGLTAAVVFVADVVVTVVVVTAGMN